jgi:hypothetical protein
MFARDHLPAIAVNAASNLKDACRLDFGSLSPENAQIVRQCGERIHIEKKKTTDSAIAIGRELIVVKKTLPHGAFQAWVESECGFSMRSAQIYMRVARLAAKNANVALLPLNTAYRMGGRRISRWMLNAAAERVADGEEMTEAAVERLYKIFTRRARRKSRGLNQNADIRKSERNAREHVAGQSPRAGVVADSSRVPLQTNRPLPKWVVSDAEYCVNKYGKGIWVGLLFLWRLGELDDFMRALWRKLVIENANNSDNNR